MNPNYQTPAYDAPYRPGYSGPDPYSFYGKPSYAGAVSNIASPFYKEPYWNTPSDTHRQDYNALGQKPVDAGMTFAQRVIMPALAIGAGMRMMSQPMQAFGRGVGTGMAGRFGMGAMGTGLMGGAGSLIGMAGAFGLATAGADMVDSLAFQPYIRARQNADLVQNHFSNINFGGNYGNVSSGKGLSGSAAADIGIGIEKFGAKDMAFSSNQISGIASMGMQAGLFDDVGAKGIVGRVSSIAAQIKTIVAISKDPNIQNAIQELAKLQQGGASIHGGARSTAAAAFGGLGAQASAAGVSVQHLMNTVGNQGQYMFGMNGITPYLGQMAAAQAFAGFSVAKRSGLISTESMARMGGLEGATQSALAAQLAGAQTPYQQIQNTNRYLFGNKTGGVINNLASFGQSASGDPMKTMGAMTLYGGQMMSAQMADSGATGPEQQAVDYLRNTNTPPDGPGGTYSPEKIAAVLKSRIGMSDEQVRAYMNMRMTQTDKSAVRQNIQAFKTQQIEQGLASISQVGGQNTRVARAVYSVRKGWGELVSSSPTSALSKIAGAMSDGFEKGANIVMGNTTEDLSQVYASESSKRVSLDKFDADNPLKKGDRFGRRTVHDKNFHARNFLKKLNEDAAGSGPASDVAREILDKGMDSPEGKRLFSKFLRLNGQDPSMMQIMKDSESSSDTYQSLASAVSKYSETYSGKQTDSVLDDLVGGGLGTAGDLRVLGQAADLRLDAEKEQLDLGVHFGSMINDPKYSGLKESMKGLSPAQQLSRVRDLSGRLPASGAWNAARIAGRLNMSPEDVMKNPAKFTNNKALQAQIKAAGSDMGRVKALMAKGLAQMAGGNVMGTSFPGMNPGMNDRDFAQVGASLDAPAKSTEEAVKNAQSEVDLSSMAGAIRALSAAGTTNNQAADKMLSAAQQMLAASMTMKMKH